MKIETVIALPDDLKDALDCLAPNAAERDDLVAAALRAYLAWPRFGEDASDRAIIDAHADELNAEAESVMDVHQWPFSE